MTLIQSVLEGMKSYRSQPFVLLKKLGKEVERVCWSFLWTRSDNIYRRSLVAWEELCLPKWYEGLNIKNFNVWSITVGKERLLIQWIHSYYIRARHVLTFYIPNTTSRCLRRY